MSGRNRGNGQDDRFSLMARALADYRNAAIPAMAGTSRLLAALNLPVESRAKQIEVIERGVLRVTKPMLKMILEHTLDTMIENTLKDGYSRRLGDYFILQMEVSGRFDSPADPAQNPPVAVMIALRTHGGVSTAKRQLHRARAFFDTWKEKYPRFTFKDMYWDGL